MDGKKGNVLKILQLNKFRKNKVFPVGQKKILKIPNG
jgi:hypothetical protein